MYSFGRTVAQVVRLRSHTLHVRDQSQSKPSGNCGGSCGIRANFSPRTSAFSCQLISNKHSAVIHCRCSVQQSHMAPLYQGPKSHVTLMTHFFVQACQSGSSCAVSCKSCFDLLLICFLQVSRRQEFCLFFRQIICSVSYQYINIAHKENVVTGYCTGSKSNRVRCIRLLETFLVMGGGVGGNRHTPPVLLV